MRFRKDDVDRYFNSGLFLPTRTLYVGSLAHTSEGESGTDHLMFEYFLKGITLLDQTNADPIIIHMNNIGGDYYHGMAIYDAIQACKSHVTIVGWGYACSMGSIILQAADSRVLSKNCVLMIHDGDEDHACDPKSFEAWAQVSKRRRKDVYRIYLKGMKEKDPTMTIRKIETLCSHDTIYTPTEAVSVGLADSVLEGLSELEGGK